MGYSEYSQWGTQGTYSMGYAEYARVHRPWPERRFVHRLVVVIARHADRLVRDLERVCVCVRVCACVSVCESVWHGRACVCVCACVP